MLRFLPRSRPPGGAMRAAAVETPALIVSESVWEQTGSESDVPEFHMPWSRLLTTVVIAGTTMHLEAFAVVDDADAGLVAVDGDFGGELEAIFTLLGDSRPGTTTILGREYVLVAYPYA
jgi:hypothetical protein